MDDLNQMKLKQQLKDNNQELHVMTHEEFADLQKRLDYAKTAAGYVAPTLDIKTAINQSQALGKNGRVAEKIINGRRYVILKGYPGLRNTLKGTKYLANHPKIVSLAIGKLGVSNSIISGAKLTIFLTVPINVVKYLIDEQATLATLIGTVSSDLVKVGVSAVMGSIAAAAVGTITTIAAGPLVAAIFVGVATSLLLDKIDSEFGLTDALIKLIDDTYQTTYDKTFGAVGRAIVKLENILRWQAVNGVPVGKGIFY